MFDDPRYIEHGYDSRQDYLRELSIQYDIDLSIVEQVAELLGPDEDFDGLIIALEDMG